MECNGKSLVYSTVILHYELFKEEQTQKINIDDVVLEHTEENNIKVWDKNYEKYKK